MVHPTLLFKAGQHLQQQHQLAARVHPTLLFKAGQHLQQQLQLARVHPPLLFKAGQHIQQQNYSQGPPPFTLQGWSTPTTTTKL